MRSSVAVVTLVAALAAVPHNAHAVKPTAADLAPFLAPVVDLPEPVVAAETTATNYTPVVFLHGMGDAGTNPGMSSLCKTASSKYPGMYSVCSNVANGMASIFTILADQVEEFAKSVQSDEKLKNGFNAVGLSQGNLVLRAYIEQINDPPVKRFISICGPHSGVGTCPNNLLYKLICPLWKLGPYTAKLSFSDYWKDSSNKTEYLSKSRWLADINNERATKNATYKANMESLEKYVLVEALNDTMVVPHVSETHGFWAWGSQSNIVPMRQSEGYQGNFIGLQTLDKAGKLDTYTYIGDHLRFSSEFWNDKILPYLS